MMQMITVKRRLRVAVKAEWKFEKTNEESLKVQNRNANEGKTHKAWKYTT